MAKNGDPQQDVQEPSRVRKASEMHKRRIDKTARRSLRQKEQEISREQVERNNQEEAERQARFTVIHGGRAPCKPVERYETSPDVLAEKPVEPSPIASHEESRALTETAQTAVGAADDAEGTHPDTPANAARSVTAVGEAKARFTNGSTAAGDSDASEDLDDFENPPGKPHRARRIILIVVAIIVAVIAILMGLFCWNRWLRYDDAAEIQGEWFVASNGRRAPITIDGDVIVFNPETKWHYALDPTAKTIAFTFGSQSGGGRYRFADNHQHLIIEDGVGFSAFDTFIADLQLTLTGQADVVPQGDTITVLSRSSDAAEANGTAEGDGSSAAVQSKEAEGEEGPDEGEEAQSEDGDEYVESSDGGAGQEEESNA